MSRQRNMPQMKELKIYPEKERKVMEASNLLGTVFKTMINEEAQEI